MTFVSAAGEGGGEGDIDARLFVCAMTAARIQASFSSWVISGGVFGGLFGGVLGGVEGVPTWNKAGTFVSAPNKFGYPECLG